MPRMRRCQSTLPESSMGLIYRLSTLVKKLTAFKNDQVTSSCNTGGSSSVGLHIEVCAAKENRSSAGTNAMLRAHVQLIPDLHIKHA